MVSLSVMPKETLANSSLKMSAKTVADDFSDQNGGLDSCNQKNPYLPWTPEEDEMIRKVIAEIHTAENAKGKAQSKNQISWVYVSSRIPGRSPKQCRERWRNALNPEINHEHWKIKEDLYLLQSQHRIGNRWVQIASGLPGRTENGVKTRFKSIMRAKKRIWKKSEDSQLMRMYNHIGANWSEIATSLPGRSINGIKLRYRQLLSGVACEPELGSPEQALKLFMNEESFAWSPGNSMNIHKRYRTSSSFEGSNSHMNDQTDPTSLDTVHPTKYRRCKGTRAKLLDDLEKEQNNSRNEFADMIASVLSNRSNAEGNEYCSNEVLDFSASMEAKRPKLASY